MIRISWQIQVLFKTDVFRVDLKLLYTSRVASSEPHCFVDLQLLPPRQTRKYGCLLRVDPVDGINWATPKEKYTKLLSFIVFVFTFVLNKRNKLNGACRRCQDGCGFNLREVIWPNLDLAKSRFGVEFLHWYKKWFPWNITFHGLI